MNTERGLPALHDIQVSLAVVLITGAPGGCILTERTHRHTRKGAVISVSVHIINSLFSGLLKTAARKLHLKWQTGLCPKTLSDLQTHYKP